MTDFVADVFNPLIEGIKLIGTGVANLLVWVFSLAGIALPLSFARIALLLVTGYTIYRYSRNMPKYVLIICVMLCVAILLGFF